MSNTKYALFEYNTENVGDEVQSIAARRFLPQVDYYIDRDEITNFKHKSGENVKLIMNGWYMHKPENWPPKVGSLDPLLISMYIDQKNKKTVQAFTSDGSKKFLEKYGPVGARDEASHTFLQKNNISSYFSGCVTLTLQRDSRFPRSDFVLLVDVSPEVEEVVRKTTTRPVISLSVYRTPYLSREEKFVLAEYYLYLYQSAHAVITTRLHTMLPSLAFETPVALIKEKGKFEPSRYEGLVDLVHAYDEKDYINNPKIFDVDNQPSNKPDYMELRRKLIASCKEFTGHENETYLTVDLSKMYKNISFVKVLGRGSASTYRELLKGGDAAWLNRVSRDLKRQLKQREKELDIKQQDLRQTEQQLSEARDKLSQIYNSRSWKVATALRRIKSGGKHK